jgi:hypothetical protein
MLAISLSANDYVGHVFGPDSWEALDNLRRLDRALSRFFAALDQRFGAHGWSAILGADHGVMPSIERTARPWCTGTDRWQRPCVAGTRFRQDQVLAELRQIAGDDVVAVVEPYVHLSPKIAPDARARVIAALEARPEVLRVIDARRAPASCPPRSDESTEALFCRALVPGRGGDLYVAMKAGSAWDAQYVPGKGSNHGSVHLYDRTIPVLARAPGRIAAGRVIEGPIGFEVYARTAASLLGVDPPDLARGGLDLSEEKR